MIMEAVGRRIEKGAFEALGLKLTAKGFVDVDASMQTSIPGVYAIGDITGKMQLAHAASEQGIAAAEHMFEGKIPADEQQIPSCVFTDLEIAYIGLTEQQAIDKGLPVRVYKFPFMANGKALAMGEKEGFVKVITDEQYGEILGVHIIGPEASSLIHEAAMAIRLEATAITAGTMVHAHPSLSEALMEAFLGCSRGAIHF
jgi:dihydrolipoamide dehydrogenase